MKWMWTSSRRWPTLIVHALANIHRCDLRWLIVFVGKVHVNKHLHISIDIHILLIQRGKHYFTFNIYKTPPCVCASNTYDLSLYIQCSWSFACCNATFDGPTLLLIFCPFTPNIWSCNPAAMQHRWTMNNKRHRLTMKWREVHCE